MVEITVGIEGMACGMCGAHINEVVRNAFRVKKCQARIPKSGPSLLQSRISRNRN